MENLSSKELDKAVKEHKKIDSWWENLSLTQKKAIKRIIEQQDKGKVLQSDETASTPAPQVGVIPMEENLATRRSQQG